MNLGPTELLVVLAIVLLLFGSTRLPKLARSLGQASKEFKTGVKEGDSAPDDSKLVPEPERLSERSDEVKPH